MKNSYLLIAGLFLLTHQQMRAERIDTLLHFSYADLKMDTLTAPDGNTYTKLTYPGCGEGEELGSPMLPVRYIRMNLPYNAENITLNVQQGNITKHILEMKVYPVQSPATSSAGKLNETIFFKNQEIYNSGNAYMGEHSRIKEMNFLRKSNKDKKLLIAYYPITYFPSDNYYEFSEAALVSVSYELQMTDEETKAEPTITLQSTGLPAFEYCVITTRALKDSFKRLVAWKRQKGYNAGVVCVEDIKSQITGDMISGLSDDAGKIRQYLKLAYNYINRDNSRGWKSMFVLIGGHGNIIPFRYGHYHDDIHLEDWSQIDYKIPTDWYYSDLHTNWHVANDTCYGCCQLTEMNYSAETCVGRILCTNSEDVENYTDKLLRYEMNPGNGNFSYLQKAMYVQADQAQAVNEADSTAKRLHHIFPDSLIISESPSFNAQYPISPTGNEVIARMNEKHGYVTLLTHGNPYEIMVRTAQINKLHDQNDTLSFYAITSDSGSRTVSMQESLNGLNRLSNKNYPMFGYSVSCYSSTFDILTKNLYNNDWTFDMHRNIAQSFTLGKDYGGPAWIGNTRMGIQRSSPELQRQFNDLIEEYSIGMAQNESKSNFYYNDSIDHKINEFKNYIILSSNLIGCPEFYMWTAQPSLFSVTNENYKWYITPSNAPSKISIVRRDLIENDSITVFSWSDPLYTSSCDIDNGYLYTVHGRNYIPKILGLYINDGELTGTHYFFTKDVTCGGEEETACVTFTNGSDYTFESNGTFKMTKNVVVEHGARLCIKPSNINF